LYLQRIAVRRDLMTWHLRMYKILGVTIALVLGRSLLVALGWIGSSSGRRCNHMLGFEADCTWGNVEHPRYDKEKLRNAHALFCQEQQHHLDIHRAKHGCKRRKNVKVGSN
jgi:hypothetical protein